MNLEEKILQQYSGKITGFGLLPYSHYAHYVSCERERHYKQLLGSHFKTLTDCKVLEIGAGRGDNLLFLNRVGVLHNNLFGNEMMDNRLYWLYENFPRENVFPGNIITAEVPHRFDIVMQSTVFSSVPTEEDRMAIAKKMKDLLLPGGVILWYDFVYDNPKNKAVKKVTKEQIRKYFPGAVITFKKTTLLPPLARKVGRAYNFFNTVFPFLRTHVVALIQFPAA